jgi:hypothetical protein
VDLSDASDLRATVTGLNSPAGPAGSATSIDKWGDADAPVLVHFGDGDFENKYRTLVDDIGQWRAAAGRVDSVDLRFGREAVVNPDTTVVAQQHLQPTVAAPPLASAPPSAAAAASAKKSGGTHRHGQKSGRRAG